MPRNASRWTPAKEGWDYCVRLRRIDRWCAATALQAPRQYLLVVFLGCGFGGLNASVPRRKARPGQWRPSAAGSACHRTLCKDDLAGGQISSAGMIRVGMAPLRTRRGGISGRALRGRCQGLPRTWSKQPAWMRRAERRQERKKDLGCSLRRQ
ncbi:hypothetical protein P171DRAFT_117307 [Karstenula rhodostoma CBS 690.94]|uniref:Uncharacterized protein n=1 Tax=Karstenula rhodostoma CBS 690.94 TaxID=1392251 RepID=A0A9P4PAV7_9PLEO|nr:hypothetical protein P171DRAFT_117307 [Karstenula rhodostoma CBS 690.94]